MSIITTAELAAHVGITDSNDNTALAYAAAAACQSVQGWCGRTFDVAGVTATARYFWVRDSREVQIDDCTEITAVATDSGDAASWATALTTSDYSAQPIDGVGPTGATGFPLDRIVGRNSYRFPCDNVTVPAVKVTAKWGWAAIPDSVKLATLMIGAEHHRSRGGSVEFFTAEGNFVQIRRNGMVRDLLAPFRAWRSAPAVA